MFALDATVIVAAQLKRKPVRPNQPSIAVPSRGWRINTPIGDRSSLGGESTPPTRVLLGALLGFALAVVFGIFTALIYLGAFLIDALSGSRLTESGFPLARIVLAYSTAGVLAGSLVGGFLPYARGRLGAIIVGFLAALPVGFGFMFIDDDISGPDGVFSVISCSLLLGGALGYHFLYQPKN